MRSVNGTRPYPFLFVLLLCAQVASAQNLLLNPGFDRDLTSWTPSLYPATPDAPYTSVSWVTSDAAGSGTSGGVSLRARALTFSSSASASAWQCAAATPGSLATVSARILTVLQIKAAGAFVEVAFYPSPDCTGTSLGGSTGYSLPFQPLPTDSGGQWLHSTTKALTPTGAQSIRVRIGVQASWTRFYGDAEIEAIADDVVLSLTSITPSKWIVPSAAWLHGANGSHWMTRLTITNPGSEDAAVTLKWLGHDMDGRGGRDFAYFVRGGHTVSDPEANWEMLFREDWGALLVSSSSPSVLVQSETSTWSCGGTVGQALPSLGTSEFAGVAIKTLAPIRENFTFRTNLVLANPTEIPVTAVVVLYADDGTVIGSRDVPLPPLGMTQICRVAAVLGTPVLELGRLSISTVTPGGLVAAYASTIDNVSNDPRTILPR